MVRPVVESLVTLLRMHRQAHDRGAAEAMVRLALMSHTGLLLVKRTHPRGDMFSLVLENGAPIMATGGHGSTHLFTLEEIEEGMAKAGINSRKK